MFSAREIWQTFKQLTFVADQVQLLKRKFEGNQTDKMKAERQCQEAQTKLEVLSKYFKEKEAELTRSVETEKHEHISKFISYTYAWLVQQVRWFHGHLLVKELKISVLLLSTV